MIKLPDKGRCKRKEFRKALSVGSYVYLEFMNGKNTSKRQYRWGAHHSNDRDMTPRPKILKVVDSNTLELMYFYGEDKRWKKPDEDFDEDIYRQSGWYGGPNIRQRYKAHNIWCWFQRDEIRHIKVMSREELAEEYLLELL